MHRADAISGKRQLSENATAVRIPGWNEVRQSQNQIGESECSQIVPGERSEYKVDQRSGRTDDHIDHRGSGLSYDVRPTPRQTDSLQSETERARGANVPGFVNDEADDAAQKVPGTHDVHHRV